ncbi:MAG: hypothetical protein NTZ64_02655 [Polaromonas sp.]|nr:hypothetical protein [Polaromonas sp.]
MHRCKTNLAQGALGNNTPSTPAQRCAPGAAHHLSSGAMMGVCAAFAVGLAAGTLALREQHRRKQQTKTPAQETGEAPFVVRRVRAGQVV